MVRAQTHFIERKNKREARKAKQLYVANLSDGISISFHYLPLIKVGPRFSIVSFSTTPKLYWEMFLAAVSSTLDPYNLLIRILIAAEAKDANTFKNIISINLIRMHFNNEPIRQLA